MSYVLVQVTVNAPLVRVKLAQMTDKTETGTGTM